MLTSVPAGRKFGLWPTQLEKPETFGKILLRQDPKTRQKWEMPILNVLVDPNTVPYLRRNLRHALPLEVKRAVEFQETQKKLVSRTGKNDPCTLVCDLVNHIDAWVTDKDFSTPDKYFSERVPVWTWHLANKGLAALFLSLASPHCKAEKMVAEKLNQWFRATESHRTLERMSNLTDHASSPEIKKRIIDFASGRGAKKSTGPLNNAEVYGRSFFRMLSEVTGSPEFEKSLDPKVAMRLSQSLTNPTEFHFDGRGSLMTNHLLAKGVLGLSGVDSAEKREALRILEEEVECAKKRWGNVVALRYEPERSCSETISKGQTKNSPREAGPRAVVVHLALYLNSVSAEQKETRRRNLIEALQAYDDYLLDHFDMIGTDSYRYGGEIHLHDVPDQNMAPYFAPAASLYAAAAASFLFADKRIEEKETLQKIRGNLRDKFRSEYQGSGPIKLFKAQGQEHFEHARIYDNAQIGLALLALLEPDDACALGGKPSLGILRPILALATHRAGQTGANSGLPGKPKREGNHQ